MKILHWGLNAALLAAGGACLWLAFTTPETVNKVGCGVVGLAFLAGCAALSWYTWKRG